MSEPIAIIGSGCRFPGNADTPSALWEVLSRPRDLLVDVPEDRFSANGFYHENGRYHGHTNVRKAYFLDNSEKNSIRRFDAPFFGISPAEANTMDPQTRLLLETVYESLESAGQTIEALRGSNTAVYAGLMAADYEHIMGRDENTLGPYHVTGTSRALLSNRISFFFDWHGPSMTIDTACSSSLYAVHYAVQQIRSGISKLAIAAGSNLILDPINFISESKLQMLSPNGRGRMWDADADGYARGEGVAVLVLKSLALAQADGDHIECVIRETAVNQDGRTKGITVPSAEAQAALIRECYRQAGLDLRSICDQPQYFEAHGTGTPAGDPVEAEAISSAFPRTEDAPLYVGSIKTIIGHTEGTAGIAGILKASLALRNSTIPPNMLFESLNPQVKPFYTNLCVPTDCVAWPPVGEGSPRRASVNSFGFGGANAHAILESYDALTKPTTTHSGACVTPFVLSAASDASLASYAGRLLEYLNNNSVDPSFCLADLSYTLHSRRSQLPVRMALSAATPQQLAEKLDQKLSSAKSRVDESLGIRKRQQSSDQSREPRILAIFTGQGAQWARMGAELISTSESARALLKRLDMRLARLPAEDRPNWSLSEEISKSAEISRVNQAELSQPLCTAIQIVLVDALRAAKVKLTDVVGHSSGEIGALYAAGFLTPEDAICIAYYRGLYAHLACGYNGEAGAMIAVGSTLDDAQELLDEPEFKGRVCVAAVNSSSSITISGDIHSIQDLQSILEDEKKFARVLKVDKAYHSHHMLPCSEKYLRSLQQLNIKVQLHSKLRWFSTVSENEPDLIDSLSGEYWVRNMRQPVLFRQALERACANQDDGQFDLAVEIGAHPALRGPASQTLSEVYGQTIPYTGLLQRSYNDIDALSDGLGHVWLQLGPEAVDFNGYESFATGSPPPRRLVEGLPKYQWNHEHEYWHESRQSRSYRHRPDPPHELLGHLCSESTETEMRWKHTLRPSEITWLQGHRLQGQIVFPAAGYIVSAMEAAVLVAKQRHRRAAILEIRDFHVTQALTFDDEDHGAEILVSMTNIEQDDDTYITANFTYNAESGRDMTMLRLLASGSVRIRQGTPCPNALSPKGQIAPDLIHVDSSAFYKSLADLEYQYSGPFEALSGLQRRLGDATGYIKNVSGSPLVVHPATLDAALQSMLLAASYPGDGVLWSMHVPVRLRQVLVNLSLCDPRSSHSAQLAFEATVPITEEASSISGDVNIYPPSEDHAMIQIQGLQCVPFTPAGAGDDKFLFSSTIWGPTAPVAEEVAFDGVPTTQQIQLAYLLERMAYFYLRSLQHSVSLDHHSRHSGPYAQLFRFASQNIASIANGGGGWHRDWEHDTPESISLACRDYAGAIDVRLLHAIGENLAEIATGRATAIEIGMKENLLTEYYRHGLGMGEYCRYLSRVVKQISHRFPRLRCLEIGAGTGGATRRILEVAGETFSSYIFTDISSGFFEIAQAEFEGKTNCMDFRVLDISQDPCIQGFEKHSCDLVVASMVLHATPSIKETLRNVRRLLRPGGYLVVIEVQADAPARVGTMFGAFSGWWVGAGEGRELSPCLHLTEWDEILRQVGFSGCDTTTPDTNPFVQPMTLFVSQAVDERILFQRSPLSYDSSLGCISPGPLIDELIMVGGCTLKTTRLAAELKLLLKGFCGVVKSVRSLVELQSLPVTTATTVLSMVELDRQLFTHISEPGQWESLKLLLQQSGCLIWTSQGRRSQNCHSNMTVGLLRAMAHEIPGSHVQSLDIEDPNSLEARTIAEAVLRFKAETLWQQCDATTQHRNAVERELVIERNGRTVIPRLMINRDMNDRYNSRRRPITSFGDYSQAILEVAPSQTRHAFLLSHQALSTPSNAIASSTRNQVSYSMMVPVRTAGPSRMFLSLGNTPGANAKWVAFSPENKSDISPVAVHELDSGTLSRPIDFDARFLYQTYLHQLVSQILKGTTNGDEVLLLEPATDLMSVLNNRAREIGVAIIASTASSECSEDFLRVHPFAPGRTLRRLRLDKITVFVDFSSTADSKQVAEHIESLLSEFCRLEDQETLCGKPSRRPHPVHSLGIQDELSDAVARAGSDIAACPEGFTQCQVVELGDLRDHMVQKPNQSVINWAKKDRLAAQISPVASQPLFSASKTYWLVGLTSSLGRSLCSWMVNHGARYVVMTSRAPRIEDVWLHEMSELGATVNVRASDITDKASLDALYDEICATMPPIAGVAQGAMVLDDMSIETMSLEALQKVTKPKVEGSIHLNEMFRGRLDFFIFLSSISPVVGIPGQSAYAAANMFMLSLAEQRREHGLAASVIHIGPILGAGYITERNHDTTYMLQSMASMHMSEHDFHQLFAEGIVAGYPSSSGPLEVTAGIRRVSLIEESQPKWATNPFMGHFILEGGSHSSASSHTSKRILSLERQLADARSGKEVRLIVRNAVVGKLGALFRLDVDTMDSETLESTRLDELGIDSLMAVEIRGWLMEKLTINYPVLKILNGISIGELISAAVAGVNPAMIPNAQTAHAETRARVSEAVRAEHGQSHATDPDESAAEMQTSSTTDDDTLSRGNGSMCRSSSLASSRASLDADTPCSEEQRQRQSCLTTFELSYTQRMFWFASKLFGDDTSLNHTALFRLTGPIRFYDLAEALKKVGEDHESLRTLLVTSRERLEQGVMATSTLRLEHSWISDERQAFKTAREVHSRTYSPESGPSLCLCLLSLTPMVHFLILGGTGLVMDGLSSQVFLRDLARHYSGDKDHFHRYTPQYRAFVKAQNQAVVSGDMDKELAFWKAQYPDIPPPLPILRVSEATARPMLTSFAHVKVDARVDFDTKERIKETCRQYRVTPFHFYLSCFRALIARLTDAEDVSIGVGDAHRWDDDSMNCIGPFLNVLPLRFRTSPSMRFNQVLQESCRQTYEALEHSKLPFQELLDQLEPPRSATSTPIFQAFVDYRQGQRERQAWADCDLEMLSLDISKTGYDLNLDIIDDPDGECMLMLFIRSDLYTAAEAGTIVTCYEKLVKFFACRPKSPLFGPQIFEPHEVLKSLELSRGQVSDSEWSDTVIHRFEHVASVYPDRVAIREENQRVNYSELVILERSIAAEMSAAGTTKGSIIAVLQEPTVHWIASILAIMRLGAVYLPLDLSAPWSRLVAAVQNCQPCLVLVDKDTSSQVHKLEKPDLKVVDVSSSHISTSDTFSTIACCPKSTALILYTSGSTGAPKGIELRHESIRNQVEPMKDVYGIEAETVLQQSSCSFDLSYSQIFTALCFGGSLCIVPRYMRADALAISGLIASEGVTYTLATPTEYSTWLQHDQEVSTSLRHSSWTKALCAGEQLSPHLLAQFRELEKKDLRLFNAYGPTEMTVLVTAMELQYHDHGRYQRRVPAGKVLPNYSLYVVDEGLHILPPGVQGEIYLGGAGTAAGYIQNPSLTADKFVQDIFASDSFKVKGWTTMHRVGDVGRWTSDGFLVIEGRVSGDTQIKLNGIRVDLLEVEDAILRTAGGCLSQAAASLRCFSDIKREVLIAHAVFRPDYPEEGREVFLRNLVGRIQLPTYMRPAVIFPLDMLPRTLSSKLDRKAISNLPTPEIIWHGDPDVHSSSLTPMEARLRDLWVDLLPGLNRFIHCVTSETDFFDVGGTSLSLISLQAEIRAAFDLRLPVVEMLQYSSLGGMASLLGNQYAAPLRPIDWDHETTLPPAALEPDGVAGVLLSDASHVVLTGSTGYLGRAVLDSLIADEQVETVYCVGIRNLAKRTDMVGLPKVQLYEGDLTLPRLGLTERDAQDIFARATRIIHNGANASHMRYYQSLRLPNLESTKQLVEMAARLRRRIPIHYVSTTTLGSYYAAGTGNDVFPPVSLAAYQPPTDGFGGYPASKWASEQCLEQLHDHWLPSGGWPIFVHRPSLISRAVDDPSLDVVHNVRHFSRRMHAVPVAPNVVGWLDEVPLSIVVSGIVTALREPEAAAPGVRFRHYCGSEQFPLSNMKSWIMGNNKSSHEEDSIEELPLDEWANRAAEMGMDPTVVTWAASVAGQRDLKFPMVSSFC